MTDDVLATGVDSLAERLKRTARGRQTLDIAQFQFLGLDEIREAYGERWPQQKDRIRDVAQHYISRRLGEGDLLVPGADGFLLIFGEQSGKQAEKAALGLSHGLNGLFLGEPDKPQPSVQVQTRPINVDELAGAFAASEFSTAPVKDVCPGPADVEWLFQPVWDVRNEAITGYHMAPYSRDTRERIAGYQFEPTPGRGPLFGAIDEEALKTSEMAMRSMFAEGLRALVGVTVHISSLTSLDGRSRLLQVMQRFDPHLMRYRILKIAGIAPGFPRLYLDEAVGAVKARLPHVVLKAAWDEPDLPSLVRTDPQGIAFALPSTVSGPQPLVPREDLLKRLRAGLALVHAHRRPVYIEGQFDPDLAQHLRGIGADYLSSPLIWSPSRKPDSVLRWKADRLIAA